MIGDPIGINVFDFLEPEYKKQFAGAMGVVLSTCKPVNIQYSIRIKQEVRHQVGIMSYCDDHIVLDVTVSESTQQIANAG